MWRILERNRLVHQKLSANKAGGNTHKTYDDDLILREHINAGLQCPRLE